MKIEEIAKNVSKGEDGIYYSKNSSTISYPESGNENFMQIEQDSFWFNHRNNVIIEAVKKYNKSNIFFDIGGGNGFVSKGIQDAGMRVVLVEPGSVGAQNAINRKIENVICSTFEDAGFENSSLDSVGMFDVIEHIEEDVDFLQKTNTYLKEDGLIFITVPSFEFLWSDEDKDAGHYRRYTLKSLKKTLLEAGYQIEYSTYIFSILPLPILLFRSIPSRLGFSKNPDELQRHQEDHKTKKGLSNQILQKIWDWEIDKVRNAKKISFGSSCFVVGKKMAQHADK
ncbi:MAG: class I SAM-dependent methyltransferase [Flavobacteriales bacterium]|nr:class I SAM-dependent methyltransferase [Flavobacteriales bacterium]